MARARPTRPLRHRVWYVRTPWLALALPHRRQRVANICHPTETRVRSTQEAEDSDARARVDGRIDQRVDGVTQAARNALGDLLLNRLQVLGMPGQYETGHCKRDHHDRNQRENAEVRDTSSVIVAFLLLKPSGRANQMIEPGSRCPLLLEKARCVVVRVSHCRPPHVRSGVVSPNSRKSALRCQESDLVIDSGESA